MAEAPDEVTRVDDLARAIDRAHAMAREMVTQEPFRDRHIIHDDGHVTTPEGEELLGKREPFQLPKAP